MYNEGSSIKYYWLQNQSSCFLTWIYLRKNTYKLVGILFLWVKGKLNRFESYFTQLIKEERYERVERYKRSKRDEI